MNIGCDYRGDNLGFLADIEYDNKTLILSDGVAYHTPKFYSQYPIYVYDP